MEKKKKPRPQYVLDALMTGKSLRAIDIQRMVSDASGEEIKIEDITSLIAKLRNAWTFQVGHFINRNRTPQGYEYSLVPEILRLTSEEIYGLTLKIGKDRFTLKMALEKIPELGQYVKKSVIRDLTRKTVKKTLKKKTSTRNLLVKASQPAPEAETKPTEPEIQAATVKDIVSIFLNEIEKIGGLKVNLNFNLKMSRLNR